jgi:hypothetical protein
MQRRRASGSLGNEELYVMEKGKWMLNLRNQAIYEESYITKCQSLLNQVLMLTKPKPLSEMSET